MGTQKKALTRSNPPTTLDPEPLDRHVTVCMSVEPPDMKWAGEMTPGPYSHHTQELSVKIIRAIVWVVALAVFAAGAASVIASPSPQSGQCPGATTIGNTATSDGSIVLAAGLSVCIHAGNGNTGTFITDGTSTLADYILASGLLNHGGQVPTVSNYVIYTEEGSSSTPSPSDHSATPTPMLPTPTPTATATGTPKATPTPSITVPESPSLKPSPKTHQTTGVPNTAYSPD